MLRLPFSRPRALRGARLGTALDSPVVSTERLTLRPHRLDDADDWFAIQSDPAINHDVNWPERSRGESFEHLRHRTRHTRLEQADDFLALAIEHDGRMIGDVSLRLRTVHAPTSSVEIAWMINPLYGGQGFVTEAASAALDLAFDRLGVSWAVAFIDTTNVRSIAVAQRLGLRGIPVDGDNMAFFGTPALRDPELRSSVRGIEYFLSQQ